MTEPTMLRVTVCELCVQGAGGICHVPGCAFWMRLAPPEGCLDLRDDDGVLDMVERGDFG
jgi:hypothetical protein